MDLCLHIVSFFFILIFIRAEEIAFNFKDHPPCFKVRDVPQCNSSLANSFHSNYSVSGPNEPDTKVYLFTRNHTAEPLQKCGGGLPPESNYNTSTYTIIIIHGLVDGVCRTAWMREMRDQFFLRGDFNVILVDWTWGNGPNISEAENNSRIVGQQVGFVINTIVNQTDNASTPEQFHIIGHSLGAIAAGYAGRLVKGVLRRITGLDPSFGPISRGPPDQRITFRDAKIVDIIHSNSYHNQTIGIGDDRHLGDADFYPNGGLIQCSCYPYVLTNESKIGDVNYVSASLEDPRLCFHLQSLQYFKVSINPDRCEFIGLACDSYEDFLHGKCNNNDFAVMGLDYEKYHKDDGKRRKYYLQTCVFSPFYDNPKSLDERDDLPFNNTCTKCKGEFPSELEENETASGIIFSCVKFYEAYEKTLITSEEQQASTQNPSLLDAPEI